MPEARPLAERNVVEKFTKTLFLFAYIGIENPCDGNPCSDVCLLSSAVREGYTCACPRGGQVMDDGVTCDCKLP